MADFQPETSFRRRPRGSGSARRSLADLLVATASPPTEASVAVEPDDEVPTAAPSVDDLAAPTVATPVLFTESDVAAMLAESATSARLQALVDAEAETSACLARAESDIAAALAAAVGARSAHRSTNADLVQTLVERIARHVVPRAIAAAPLVDLEEALAALLERLERPQGVEILVHPDLVAPLQAKLEALSAAAGFHGDLSVAADRQLAPGDAVARWTDGEARHTQAARIDEALVLCRGWLAERDARRAGAATDPAPESGPPETPDMAEGNDEH